MDLNWELKRLLWFQKMERDKSGEEINGYKQLKEIAAKMSPTKGTESELSLAQIEGQSWKIRISDFCYIKIR